MADSLESRIVVARLRRDRARDLGHIEWHWLDDELEALIRQRDAEVALWPASNP